MSDELLSLIESVLGESEPRAKGNYRFKCPLKDCSSVRKRLEIQLDTDESGHNPWKCWVCLKGGRTIKALFNQVPDITPDKFTKLKTLVKPQKESKEKGPKLSVTLPEEFRNFQSLTSKDYVGKQCLKYLRKRHWTDEDLLKYQVGFCETGRYANRIIFPSFDLHGNINYFAGRTIFDDEERKYNYPEIDRSDIIPFELFINWNAPITLCEGFMDAKAIRRNALPLLEKGITQAILKKLLKASVEKIYIALDKDALREALKHAEMLIANGKKVYLIDLPGKDPDEMGFVEYTKLVQKAILLTHNELMKRSVLIKMS